MKKYVPLFEEYLQKKKMIDLSGLDPAGGGDIRFYYDSGKVEKLKLEYNDKEYMEAVIVGSVQDINGPLADIEVYSVSRVDGEADDHTYTRYEVTGVLADRFDADAMDAELTDLTEEAVDVLMDELHMFPDAYSGEGAPSVDDALDKISSEGVYGMTPVQKAVLDSESRDKTR